MMRRFLGMAVAACLLGSCCGHCYGTGNVRTRVGEAPCPYCGGDGGWVMTPGSSAFDPDR